MAGTCCVCLSQCGVPAGWLAGWLQVSMAVMELQSRLPHARVLYASATGVSEVANMAYMSRMGLWGAGTAFDSFDAFLESMRRRGVRPLQPKSLGERGQAHAYTCAG